MSELISHSFKDNGQVIFTPLFQHLNLVGERCSKIVLCNTKSINLAISSQDLMLASFLTGICHDFGKAKKQFQDYIRFGIKKDKDHALLSAIFTFIVAYDIFKEKEIPARFLPFICAFAVSRHHGHLIDLDESFKVEKLEVEYEIAKDTICEQIWDYKFEYPERDIKIDLAKYKEPFFKSKPSKIFEVFIKFSKHLRSESEKPEDENTFLFDLYFSLFSVISNLTEADQATVIEAPITKQSKRIKSGKVRDFAFKQLKASSDFQKLREKAWREIERFNLKRKEKFFRLTLPTGLGKTLMGLYLGAKCQENIGKPIIYSLPFLAVIEQTTDVIKSIFSSEDSPKVIQHHSLSFPPLNKENEELNFSQARFSLENWEADIVITTFDQLLYSFLSCDRTFIRRFIRLPGSVLVLDEVQSIPARLIPIVKTLLLSLSKKMNVKVQNMTATHPPFLKEDVVPIIKNENAFYKQLKRTQLRLQIKESIPFTQYLSKLPCWLSQRKRKNILFVANTIRSSLYLYDFLNSLTQDKKFKNFELVYLSGNIVPVQRIDKINQIKDHLKQENPNKKIIVISTQCIEAGVDISMDEIVRDFAPWDSIMQVCGRGNRFGNNKLTDVWIYRWIDDLSTRGQEFNQYIYDPIFIGATRDAIGDLKKIEEGKYLEIQKKYISLLENRVDIEESRKFLKKILSWQFDSLSDFRRLFRGFGGWKVSVFCIADDTSDKLKDIGNSFWRMQDRTDSIQKIEKLCSDKILFSPIEQFLRTKGETILHFLKGLKKVEQKQFYHQFQQLISPMYQAYTISLTVDRIENLPLNTITEGFYYLPREYYNPDKGFSLEPNSELRNNIL